LVVHMTRKRYKPGKGSDKLYRKGRKGQCHMGNQFLYPDYIESEAIYDSNRQESSGWGAD